MKNRQRLKIHRENSISSSARMKGDIPAQSDALFSLLRSFLVQRQRATNTGAHDLADPDRSLRLHLCSLHPSVVFRLASLLRGI